MEQYDQRQPYQQPQYQQAQAPNPLSPGPGPNPTFAEGIIFSIIQILLVPCLYGLIPLILTITANSSWKHGRYEDYQKKTKAANICLIIGWVLLGIEAVVVIGGMIYIFFGLANSGF